jgi:hypothetical protein
MLCMGRKVLAILLSAPITFISCAQPTVTRGVAKTESHALKSQIPAPDPGKYHSILEARNWQNPYLIVRANGIDVRPISAVTQVPTIAWPYGLVVAVSENGVRVAGDDARIKRNREELVGLLKNAGVTVNLWPSA